MKIAQVVLIIMLLLCLLPMPYDYYTLVRFISMIVFSVLAYSSYKSSNISFVILFISLAILFQPLIKISLGRFTWNIIDVIVAIILVINLIKNRK